MSFELSSSGGTYIKVALEKERNGFDVGGISDCCTKTTDKVGLNFLVGGMSTLLTHFVTMKLYFEPYFEPTIQCFFLLF